MADVDGGQVLYELFEQTENDWQERERLRAEARQARDAEIAELVARHRERRAALAEAHAERAKGCGLAHPDHPEVACARGGGHDSDWHHDAPPEPGAQPAMWWRS